MANHDFSHLFSIPAVLADTLERRYRVTDENWLLTAQRIEPKLLNKADMDDLRWVLDHTIERRGGKSIRTVSEQLITALRRIQRDDVDPGFLEGLIQRLNSGVTYTQRDSDRDHGKRHWLALRDQIIVYLYDYIYDELDENRSEISHDVFGTFPVPAGTASRSDKTLAILDDLLTNRSTYDPPARSTLMKIVAEARYRKRRPRT